MPKPIKIQDLPSTDSWLPLFLLVEQDYVGQMLLQEAVRNHGRVDLMTKKNGEKLAATWFTCKVCQQDFGSLRYFKHFQIVSTCILPGLCRDDRKFKTMHDCREVEVSISFSERQ